MEREPKRKTWRRATGFFIVILGLAVLLMPIFVGGWVLGLLGRALVAVGLFQFVNAVRSTDRTEFYVSFLTGIVTIALGGVLFLSPNTALFGLNVIITVLLLTDGVIKLYGAYTQTTSDRWWNLFNGLVSIGVGFLIWYLVTAQLGIVTVGVAIGMMLLVQGWTMFFVRENELEEFDNDFDPREHPDPRLGLEPSDAIMEVRKSILTSDPTLVANDIAACLTFLGIFFVIHALRTEAKWSFIGLISPFAAVAGDAVVAIVLAAVLILPLQLAWRKLTRSVERVAWRRFTFLYENKRTPALAESVLRYWLQRRMGIALVIRQIRYSINFAFWNVLRTGLPLTAILIAINSIWGFSWYFNSENWASGVYQEIAKGRVDAWRTAMASEVEKQAVAAGIEPHRVFRIEPEGVTDEGDFSFVVIGDTGEGDPSQMSLRPQLIAASARQDTKFFVLSSDVIYPDG